MRAPAHRHRPAPLPALGASRRWAVASRCSTSSFDDARRAAKALGGSLNDLFVTAAAAAAGAYHRDLGADGRRAAHGHAGQHPPGPLGRRQQFVPTRVLVPTGDLDPVTRFDLVHEALSRTKQRAGHRRWSPGLAGVVNLLPTSVVVRIARQQAETVDFTTSNVRAAPFDLYIAGARIEATYPIGPAGRHARSTSR